MIDINDTPPVQEYEERKSITREEWDNIMFIIDAEQYIQDKAWDAMQDDETEVYRGLWIEEKKANKELHHTIEKETCKGSQEEMK